MVADPDKAENAEKKQSWFQTLPGVLTAAAAALTALGGIITALLGYFGHHDGSGSTASPPTPSAATTPTSPPPPSPTPTGPTPQVAPIGPAPPPSIPTISLPGADWQGWLNEPAARCRAEDAAVAIGRTDQGTRLVVCSAGSGDLYYKAVTRNDSAIELPGAKRAEGGFDVTTVADGKTWLRQIRKDKLTILVNGSVFSSEQFRGYASS